MPDETRPEQEQQTLEPSPSESWLDVLYGVLFQPRDTFARLRSRPPYALAVTVFVVVGLIEAVAAARAMRDMPSALQPLLPLVDAAPPAGVLGVLGFWLSLLAWIGFAALFHLGAEVLGGRGSAGATFAFVGLARLPKVFVAPLSLLRGAAAVGAIASILTLALEVWRYYLYYRAVRVNYALPRGPGLIVTLAPLALALLTFAFVGLVLVGYLGQLLPAL